MRKDSQYSINPVIYTHPIKPVNSDQTYTQHGRGGGGGSFKVFFVTLHIFQPLDELTDRTLCESCIVPFLSEAPFLSLKYGAFYLESVSLSPLVASRSSCCTRRSATSNSATRAAAALEVPHCEWRGRPVRMRGAEEETHTRQHTGYFFLLSLKVQ